MCVCMCGIMGRKVARLHIWTAGRLFGCFGAVGAFPSWLDFYNGVCDKCVDIDYPLLAFKMAEVAVKTSAFFWSIDY